MRVGVWAPTQRISKRNSTGNASWGVGPNTEDDEKSAYNNVQVGDGPQQREIDSQFLQTMKLGWDDEINFAKISFLSHSLKTYSFV